MVKIVDGERYTAARFRSGESERGPWEVITVKEEGRAKQEITIFPTNIPTGVTEGGSFAIYKITSVARKKKKDSAGNWTLVDVCVECECEPVAAPSLDIDDDPGDMPFTWGGDYDELSDGTGSLDGII
jgi:hypothetical protein